MPCGKRCASATTLPLASRLTCQQSSMLTYTYPASFIPDFTIASAMPLIMSSLTLQANLFHEFQPIGGVSAKLADGAGLTCANIPTTRDTTKKDVEKRKRFVLMRNVLPELVQD